MPDIRDNASTTSSMGANATFSNTLEVADDRDWVRASLGQRAKSELGTLVPMSLFWVIPMVMGAQTLRSWCLVQAQWKLMTSCCDVHYMGCGA